MPSQSVVKLLLIHAETPLHPGSGSALGTVDLPVAREKHTQFPYIPGSSLKGVLRDVCRVVGDTEVVVAFGPDTKNASDHAGALSLTDARLLAMPLRSLKGLFAWVTCPCLLERLVRDSRLLGENEVSMAAKALVKKVREMKGGDAYVAPSSPLMVGSNASEHAVVFEEFDYDAIPIEEVRGFGQKLSQFLGGGEEMRLATHLAVIDDTAFGFAARFATEVMARIALDDETKTVTGGALFYEEFLPAGTLLYSLAIADQPRAKAEARGAITSAEAVAGVLTSGLEGVRNVVQIGANATTGKGICTVVQA